MTKESNFKLDTRIKSIDDIQTILHYDVNFIGCKGYFFDEFIQTKDLSKCRYGELIDITTHDDRNDLCFKAEYEEELVGFYRFFILEADLKPVEKKFRPFTPEEFVAEFPVGSKIIYRHIGEDREINIVVITRIETTEDFEFINVYFGTDLPWEMKYMFETLEIKIDSKWQPFGVEE